MPKYVATIYFNTDIRGETLEEKLALALEQWLELNDVHVEDLNPEHEGPPCPGIVREPTVDDSVKFCPDCERPNQFGELCYDCRRERDAEQMSISEAFGESEAERNT